MKKSSINVQDSYFGFGDTQSYEYFQIKEIDRFFTSYDLPGLTNDFLALYFMEYAEENQQDRDITPASGNYQVFYLYHAAQYI